MPGEKEVLKTTCPARLLRRLRHRRDQARRRDYPRARRPGPPGEPGRALRQVRARLQRRLPRPRGQTADAAQARRRQGRGALRAGLMGRGPRGYRGALQGDCRGRRRGQDRACALHRHLLADRQHLPDALPRPPRRPRGGARHGVQHGGARRARLRDRHLGDRLRPAHGQGRALDRRLGREPVCVGAAPAQALAEGGAGHGDRDRPGAPPDRRTGRHSPAALPRQRCGAGVCHGPRAGARRDDRPCLPRRARARLGRAGTGARPLYAGLGRGPHRRTGGGDRRGSADLRLRARAALARPGAAAAGHGRQRDARVRATAGGDRQLRQARRRHALPQRQRAEGRGWRLSGGGGAQPESADFQPDGAGGAARGPGGHPGLPLLEHQPGGLEPGAGRGSAGR